MLKVFIMKRQAKLVNSAILIARKVTGLVTNVIERIWIITHPKIDAQLTVLLVGAPRSGMTWVMEITEALGSYRVVFEPFHISFYPMTRSLYRKF